MTTQLGALVVQPLSPLAEAFQTRTREKPNLSSDSQPKMLSDHCVLPASSHDVPWGPQEQMQCSKGKAKSRHMSDEKSGGSQNREASFCEKLFGSLQYRSK